MDLKKKALVFLDVDKTLINEKYELTADPTEEIKLCNELGILIGLCSDTPIEPLRRLASKIGINGPIVGEFGAIVFYPEENNIQFAHTNETILFPVIRNELISTLAGEFPDITLFVGDNTEFVRRNVFLESYEENIILVSGYRQCSLAFHCQTFNKEERRFVPNIPLLRNVTSIATAIAERISRHSHFWIDKNEEYGITIIHSDKTSKKNGIALVLDKFGMQECIMVGDGKYDLIGDSRVRQFWVQNAFKKNEESVEKFIRKGDYVSPYFYTTGVKDILKKIAWERKN